MGRTAWLALAVVGASFLALGWNLGIEEGAVRGWTPALLVRGLLVRPLPGQAVPPCGPDSQELQGACYMMAVHLDGSAIKPDKHNDCGEYYGPALDRCWVPFFPIRRSPGPSSIAH